jgi:hypothetical protein
MSRWQFAHWSDARKSWGFVGFALLTLMLGLMITAARLQSQDLSSSGLTPPIADSLRIDSTPMMGSHSPPGSQTGNAHRRSYLRREAPFFYDPGGRRDPFRPLLTEMKRGESVVTDLLRVDGAVLTGVVWSSGEYLAMVRDKDGKNFFLRQGDAVFRGRVSSVTQTKAVFQLSDFGEVEHVTLTVRANEGKKQGK